MLDYTQNFKLFIFLKLQTFNKSYDLPLDLLQYQRKNSPEGQEVDHNFC